MEEKSVKKKAASKKKAVKKAVTKKAAAKKTAPKKVATKKASRKKAAAKTLSYQQRYQMIAEAAYHISEKQGFAPGTEMDNWLQAEQQIDGLIALCRLVFRHQRRKLSPVLFSTVY